MGIETLYKEVMDLNMMADNDEKKDAAKAFFEKLNAMELPEYFNPEPARIRGGGPGDGGTPSGDAGRTVVINNQADGSLKKRWVDSGNNTIKDMLTKGDNPEVPKYNNKTPICLSWCLKGRCTQGCARAAAHKHYGPALVKSVHDLMTVCQVANPPQQ